MLDPVRVDEIAARAARAQTGTLPTDPDALASMLRRSTATREFVATARADVLDLLASWRLLRRRLVEALAEVEYLRDELTRAPEE